MFTVPTARAEEAAAIATMAAPEGLYIEDYRDVETAGVLIDEELLARSCDKVWIHLYVEDSPAEAAAFLCERFDAASIPYILSQETVEDADWANAWKAYFKPLPVGERLLICPTWEEPGTEFENTDRRVLRIDPGMAFGTGGHDTTRLVLEGLECVLRPGDAVLDVGCGSGILSVAALLLGAGSALGIDIDPVAVRTARENGELNGFSELTFNVVQGDLAVAAAGRYRVVLANIVADAIIRLAPAVPALLAPGGVFIASGIIEPREEEVTAALREVGLCVAARAQNGWVALRCEMTAARGND